MGFLYFIPYSQTWNAAAIGSISTLPCAAELRYLDEPGAGMPECRPTPGPKGEHGLLMAYQGPTPIDVDYKPDDQEWREVRGLGPEIKDEEGNVAGNEPGPTIYWIGWWKNAKPGPEDLKKRNQFSGHMAKLGDGNEWHIPIVGPILSNLPHEFQIGDGGKCEAVVVARYQEIWSRSKEFYGYVFMQSAVFRTTIFEYLADVLSLNYRIGRYEASALILNLIDTTNFREAVRISVGKTEIDAADEARKKNSAPQ